MRPSVAPIDRVVPDSVGSGPHPKTAPPAARAAHDGDADQAGHQRHRRRVLRQHQSRAPHRPDQEVAERAGLGLAGDRVAAEEPGRERQEEGLQHRERRQRREQAVVEDLQQERRRVAGGAGGSAARASAAIVMTTGIARERGGQQPRAPAVHGLRELNAVHRPARPITAVHRRPPPARRTTSSRSRAPGPVRARGCRRRRAPRSRRRASAPSASRTRTPPGAASAVTPGESPARPQGPRGVVDLDAVAGGGAAERARRALGDQPAARHHADAVAHRLDLRQQVARDEHRGAVVGQAPQERRASRACRWGPGRSSARRAAAARARRAGRARCRAAGASPGCRPSRACRPRR